jgi:pimeloyl-ACP methyl ester carboxylesterase
VNHQSRDAANASVWIHSEEHSAMISLQGRWPRRSLVAVALGLLVNTPLAGQTAKRTVEELVYVNTSDTVTNAGAVFSPVSQSVTSVAVVWIHGSTVNFYEPRYVAIARELAARGLTTIVGNTRMHDLGNVETYRGSKRVRGGAYWGVPTDQVHDIAAWIDLAEKRGFRKVILVGHSAGAPAVQIYQAQKQDPRVAGLVIASGRFQPATNAPDSTMLAQAARLVADGRGEELVFYPNRGTLSLTSASTFMDLTRNWPKDFWGVKSPNAPVERIRCPVLAWFGTNEADVGGAADLKLFKDALGRLPSGTGPVRADTTTIQGGDHMYDGQAAQVAEKLSEWITSTLGLQ